MTPSDVVDPVPKNFPANATGMQGIVDIDVALGEDVETSHRRGLQSIEVKRSSSAEGAPDVHLMRARRMQLHNAFDTKIPFQATEIENKA